MKECFRMNENESFYNAEYFNSKHSFCEKTHCNDCYEIIYTSSGFGSYVLEGAAYTLAPHTLLISAPIKYHSISYDGEAEYCIFNFAENTIGEQTSDLLKRMLGAADGVFYNLMSSNDNAFDWFEKIKTVNALHGQERDALICSCISDIVSFLSDMPSTRLLNLKDTLVPRVMRYINENIHGDLSLDSISGHFFVNKCYLCRAFKRYNGISVHTYINQKRVLYAKQIIEKGESAARAADKVGFGDYSTFYRAYIKFFDQPPTNTFRGKEEGLI